MAKEDRKPRPSTTAPPRADISAGRAGDKDATPLGTDAEAALTPVRSAAWSDACREEARLQAGLRGSRASWFIGLTGLAVAAAALGWAIVRMT
jgi:hypothetical protein